MGYKKFKRLLCIFTTAIVVEFMLLGMITFPNGYYHDNQQQKHDARVHLGKRAASTSAPGTKENHTLLWPFHTTYPVNCSNIFAGDEAAIEAAEIFLKRERSRNQGMLPIPHDTQVQGWTKNCSTFRLIRGYINTPLSHEEANFPIAYTMVVYTDAAQVERLLRAIYQPQNIYCIHIDRKSPSAFQKAVQQLSNCFDNVFIASIPETVRWGTITTLLADLRCMFDLLKISKKWTYLLNLSGKDFPLKTNLEIVRQLKAYKHQNCLETYVGKRHENRTKYIKGTNTTREPPPHNITVYKGDTYIAATREFIHFITNHKIAKDYLNWLNDAIIPDEFYYSSLHRLPNAPGGTTRSSKSCNVRFRKWTHNQKFSFRPKCIGKKHHNLCIFGTGYLKHFHRTRELFVNKLEYSFDPIAMQCIEEELDYRSQHPEILNRWTEFPVERHIKWWD